MVSGYGFGSCIWTPLQTLYINPDNLNATADNNTSCGDNKTKYFQDQGEVNNWNINFLYSYALGPGPYSLFIYLWSFQRNKVNKQTFKFTEKLDQSKQRVEFYILWGLGWAISIRHKKNNKLYICVLCRRKELLKFSVLFFFMNRIYCIYYWILCKKKGSFQTTSIYN